MTVQETKAVVFDYHKHDASYYAEIEGERYKIQMVAEKFWNAYTYFEHEDYWENVAINVISREEAARACVKHANLDRDVDFTGGAPRIRREKNGPVAS